MPVRRLIPIAVLAIACVARVDAEDAPRPTDSPFREITVDRDDIDVTASVRVKPGTYRVRDANGDGVLRVRGDRVVLDLTGVTLIGSAEGETPDTFDGIGVRILDSKNVQVRGGAIRG